MKRKRRIFLTGGSGFIGRNILEQLGEKYTFYAPSHKELDLKSFSAVEKYLKAYPVDIIIHSAKLGGTRKVQNSGEIAEINVRMFFNLVRNEKYFKKMLFLGTGAEYDVSRSLIKVKEEDFDRVVPKDSFGFCKYICSKYVEKSDNIINLRLFGIYGKYEDYELRFISNAICKNLFGLPITMHKNVFFDYLYMNDFVQILDYFLNHDVKEKFYNIGTGKSIDLLTIAQTINRIGTRKSEIIIRKKGLKNEYTCDNARLLREIRGFIFTDFEKSVRELYEWYRNKKHSLKIESFLIDR